jgi:glutamate carboxypeptidase
MADRLADLFAPLGRIRLHRSGPRAAPHIVVEAIPASASRAPLVLCHFDTVWPRGTAAERGYARYAGYAHGPGVLDMKAGIVMAFEALRVLRELDALPPAGMRISLTPDEEIGNPTSRALIYGLARRASVALVLEPPSPDGTLKTTRKGHAFVTLDVHGRAAHAGIEPEKGANAILGAAQLTVGASSLAGGNAGTTVNVGVIQGGQRANVVPARARLEIDVRADSAEELARVTRALLDLRPAVEGVQVTGEVDVDRPPMSPSEASVELLGTARAVGTGLGLMLSGGSTGGGSEGNFTAAAGVPTLDGLGPVGFGPHQREERIEFDSMLDRTALLAGLLVATGKRDT